jgi:hypothetical protein
MVAALKTRLEERAMATRVHGTRRIPPIDLGTEILARMLPARQLAEALAAEPLDTVKPLLEDLKSMGDEDAMPDFPLGAWARHVVEFQDRMRAEKVRIERLN